jgi:succinate dehydrogenase hydrophobic anchor subunit
VPSELDRPRLPRWSLGGITALILVTCGFGAIYLSWIQNEALKRLNPRALSPGVALLLAIVGAIFTAGLLGLAVTWIQAKALVDHAERINNPRRNTGLLLTVMVAEVISLVSLWFSWTGAAAFLALGFQIYAIYAFQAELELYTDS